MLSLRTISLLAVFVTALTATTVYFFGHASFWRETERVLLVLAGVLFAFLTYGLYHGYRLHKHDSPSLGIKLVKLEDLGALGDSLPDMSGTSNVGDLLSGADALDAEGCLAAIVGLIVSVVVGFFLIIILGCLALLAVNLIWLLVLVAAFAIAWVFYRALRQTFTKARLCRRRLLPSLKWAAVYTLLYTGWLYALAEVARHFYAHKLGI